MQRKTTDNTKRLAPLNNFESFKTHDKFFFSNRTVNDDGFLSSDNRNIKSEN